MIFIDRSIPRSIARALQSVRSDVVWLEGRFAHDVKDPVWLREAGQQGWLVISRDKGLRHKKAEVREIQESNVGCFIIGEKDDLSRWNLLKIIVAKLDDMELIYRTTERPFIFVIDAGGALRRVLQA